MKRSVFLPKTAAWHDADSRLFEQLYTIKRIWSLTLCLQNPENIIINPVQYSTCRTIHYSCYYLIFTVITLAAATALSGRKMRGNAYIAPATSLHFTPGMALSRCVVNWAFVARSPRTVAFSYNTRPWP